MMADELVFILVLVFLYLSDLLVLRYDREFLLVENRKTLQFYSIGDLLILKKRLEILNPFTPYRLIYRVSLWRGEESLALENDLNKLSTSKKHIKIVSFYCGLLGIVLFVNFPFLYLVIGFDYAFILTAILGYLIFIVNSLIIIKYRHEFYVDTDKLIILLIVSFVCIPLAVNLARRITLYVPIKSDLIKIIETFEDEDLFEKTRMSVVNRILFLIDEGVIDPVDNYQNNYAREKLGVCLLKN